MLTPQAVHKIQNGHDEFISNKPFNHIIIDDFFIDSIARQLEQEFPSYDDSNWYIYSSPIEEKRALNNWSLFPSLTYLTFSYLNGYGFNTLLNKLVGSIVGNDNGLHGAGWHIHGANGNLNPHLDYSIHPKLKWQRKLNLIIYLSSDIKEEHGGNLGLWDGDNKAPSKLCKEISPKFNRAVLFDTTQNSWHGLSKKLNAPEGVFRKSLAVYYLQMPESNADPRECALFAPRPEEQENEAIKELISKRANINTVKDSYRK